MCALQFYNSVVIALDNYALRLVVWTA